MVTPRKFQFEAAFAANGEWLETAKSRTPTYFAEDIDAARADGFAAGRAEALRDLQEQAARADTAATMALAAELKKAMSTIDESMAALQTDAQHLALAAARRLAGVALSEFGAARAEDVLRRALNDLAAAPSARLIVPATMLAPIAERIETILSAQNLAGRLTIVAAPSGAPHDIRLEFPAGAFALSQNDIEQKIAHACASAEPAQDETP